MEFVESTLSIKPFLTITIGIIVLILGKRINDTVRFLKDFSIPDPVTGGLIFSLLFYFIFLISGIKIDFDLNARDILLIYFFTSIGINTSLKDLITGGKPLVILVLITIGFIGLQNLIGVFIGSLFGLPKPLGLMSGSISLVGGHGTAVAWAAQISREFAIPNAMEVGIASATIGLILASILGGPIAKFLITRYQLKPQTTSPLDVGVSSAQEDSKFEYMDLLDAILAIHFCIIIGVLLNYLIEYMGLFIPLFVPCLFAGIVITNSIPRSFPGITGRAWPNRKPAMAVIADISLGAFLSMSLMSLQLWTLAELAGPLLTILAVQFVVAIAIILFVVFPLLGRNFDSAVICAGFGGYSLGSTANAMANMAAVSQRYGSSHLAFIIVPLVCAFFVNFINAIIIPIFLFNF